MLLITCFHHGWLIAEAKRPATKCSLTVGWKEIRAANGQTQAFDNL